MICLLRVSVAITISSYLLAASVCQCLLSCFDECFSDDRVADWPLMSAYWPTFALTAAYLIIVYIGPKLMTSRPPFEFRWTLFVYNAVLVALNFHICSEVC